MKSQSISGIVFTEAPGHQADHYIQGVCQYFAENTFSIADNSETSFTEKYLMPFIRPIFLVNASPFLGLQLVSIFCFQC